MPTTQEEQDVNEAAIEEADRATPDWSHGKDLWEVAIETTDGPALSRTPNESMIIRVAPRDFHAGGKCYREQVVLVLRGYDVTHHHKAVFRLKVHQLKLHSFERELSRFAQHRLLDDFQALVRDFPWLPNILKLRDVVHATGVGADAAERVRQHLQSMQQILDEARALGLLDGKVLGSWEGNVTDGTLLELYRTSFITPIGCTPQILALPEEQRREYRFSDVNLEPDDRDELQRLIDEKGDGPDDTALRRYLHGWLKL